MQGGAGSVRALVTVLLTTTLRSACVPCPRGHAAGHTTCVCARNADHPTSADQSPRPVPSPNLLRTMHVQSVYPTS